MYKHIAEKVRSTNLQAISHTDIVHGHNENVVSPVMAQVCWWKY